MLKTFIATEENYDAYLRPAIYDSIKAVLGFYKLDSAANIYYNGQNEIAKLVGTNLSDGENAERYTDGIFRNKVFIVPEVERSEFWNNRREQVEAPVLHDGGGLPLALYPSFENKKVTVKVVAMFNTQIEAEQMRARINRQRENQVVDFNFSPINHMVVNPAIVDFFSSIYDMLKKWQPDMAEPNDWLNALWTRPYRVVTNVKGEHARVVIPLKSQNIGIQFAEAFISRTNKSATYGRYEVEFNYSFYFNDFMGWELEFPLMVYQDEIPEQYIPRPQVGYTNPNDYPAAPEIEAIRELDKYMTSAQSPYYLKLPEHDPWAWPFHAWIQPVVQARLSMDPVDSQVLCNIFTDIPQFQWSEDIKAYMLRRHHYAFSHYDTPFLLQFFENDQLIDPSHLSMDENGVVTFHKAPNLRATYRLVITLDYAIRDYSEAFWDDLAMNPLAWNIMPKIFNWFDWASAPRPLDQNIWFLKKHIDKGWGKWGRPFNIYECEFGLFAHRN